MTSYYSTTITNGDSIQINLFNTTTPSVGGSGTNVVSATLNNANSGPIRLQNFASTFYPSVPNYLQVQIITTGISGATYANQALFITLSFY